MENMWDGAVAADRLDRWFDACPAAAVAFSGGVDSGLAVYWARRRLGRARATAWIADSPSLKRADLAAAVRFCKAHDIELRMLAMNEVEDENYAANPINRCYFCKSMLYRRLGEAVRAAGAGETWICSGANFDDPGDYRPGLLAAAEAKIRHPLLECGLGKDAVRALARQHDLELWDKPASPCLSSRIPYGQPITRAKLASIEAAENWLHRRGFGVCRVRHFGDRAVVALPADRWRELAGQWSELRLAFSDAGFGAVEIDEEGFVSGKLNRGISSSESTGASS